MMNMVLITFLVLIAELAGVAILTLILKLLLKSKKN